MGKYSVKIPEWPEDERPRERLIRHGAEKLSDAELLAILLRTGDKDDTAIDLARHLIHKFGSFRGLDSRSVSELCQVKGVGPAKAAQIKAAIELGKRLFIESSKIKDKIQCSEDVYKRVGPYLRDLNKEVFKVLLLTTRNNIILEKTLFEGSLTESVVSPREVIKEAIGESAAAVIFVHNHPSGDPSPSEEDKRVTTQLKGACELMGITVLDHIIIGEDRYFSFADNGMI